MKNCTPLWREAHFEVKMYKTHHGRTTFGSCDVEKVHAVVARSTFRSQNVQNTPGPDHFWKLRCRKSARRCGAKHISKSKCTKHTSSGPLLEVEMLKKCTPLWREAHFEVKMLKTQGVRTTFGASDVEKVHVVMARSTFRSCTKHTIVGPLLEVAIRKKCTPLWREAHFEVKMYKTHQVRTTFGSCDVEKVHAVVARSTFPSQNVQNTPAPDHFWQVEMSKKCTPLWREAHFEVKMLKTQGVRTTFGGSDDRKSAPLWREGHFEVNMLKTLGVRTSFGGSDVASLQYTTLQDITLHDTPVHYITLHYTPVHSTTLNYTTPHYITLNDTATQIDR